ncbi:MAG TPA: hypothetical protein VIV60_02235 [Polyangiaceae bacterium]
MSRNVPPTRIVHDDKAAGDLRALLDDARHDLPAQRDVLQFHGRLEAAIAAGKPVPNIDWGGASGAASATAGKGIGLIAGLVGGGLVLSGVLAVGIGSGLRGKGTPVEGAPGIAARASSVAPLTPEVAPPREATPIAPATTVEQPIQRAIPRQPAPPLDVPSKTTSITNTRASVQATSRPEPEVVRPTEAAAPATPTEASLLTRARAALGSDPERALALTQQHAQYYPNGALAQEREVIAIAALRALGRTDAANQRGNAFEQKYPGSAHRTKIEQTLKGRSP